MTFRHAGVSLAVAFAVGNCYLWIARTAGGAFEWTYDLGGYYDYLGRAFARGQLHVPIEPSPQLLAQPNPWDPRVDASLKVHDMALYRGRYYLYHGAGPAVLLFTPWRLITGHDLPENFGLFLLCFGGFLFSAAALYGLFDVAQVRPAAAQWGVMLFALGFCQGVPYLLNRVWVYEIAIGGAYFCCAAAVLCLVWAVRRRFSPYWLAASGLMFGMAIACRPHLGLAAIIALAGLVLGYRQCKRAIAFAIPLLLVGLAIAAYNYARFDNPFEFGIRYLLTGENQQRIRLSLEYVLPGLYFLLLCPPHFSAVFPFVTQTFRHPFGLAGYEFPNEYFIEPTVGALCLAPFLIGLLLVRRSPARTILWILLGGAASALLFVASTGFTTQRYEVDFLPLAVLAALAVLGTQRRTALTIALAAAIAFGAVVNLALGITGPYDDLLKNRPRTYLRVARWFSLSARYRPMLNPRIAAGFVAEFKPQADGFREPLLTIGNHTYRYFLYVEHAGGRLRLISQGDESTVTREMNRPAGPIRFRVTYSPETATVDVKADGSDMLRHEIKMLLTAPAQVTVGENRIDRWALGGWFTGKMQTIEETVRPE